MWRGTVWLRRAAALVFGLGCLAVAVYAFTFFSRDTSLGNPFDAKETTTVVVVFTDG